VIKSSPAELKSFKDGLQPFRGNGFHSDERALDAGFSHRVEKLRVFARFHRDLRVKDHVGGKLR
jgi:hypothetical protein